MLKTVIKLKFISMNFSTILIIIIYSVLKHKIYIESDIKIFNQKC